MKKLLACLLTLSFLFIAIPSVNAAERKGYCNFSPTDSNGQPYGNVTINTNCVIYESVTGVAAGNLTFQNAAITLNSELVFAPGKQINIGSGATLYLNENGKITQSLLCVKDADGDGYADLVPLETDPATGEPLTNAITQIGKESAQIGATECSAPYRESSVMNNLTMVDANPASADNAYATSDSELLRLGFTINGVTDAAAAIGDIQVVNKNLNVTGGKLQEGGYDLIPTGAVMNFNLTACPSGWTALAGAAGRVIVGRVANESIGSTVGTALGSLGTRTITAVPAHTHAVDPPSTASGNQSADHTHVTTITTGNPSANHTHAFSFTSDNPNNNHTHAFGTGGISANHTHAFGTGGVSANHYHYVSIQSGTVSSWHTHTFYSNAQSADHSHTFGESFGANMYSWTLTWTGNNATYGMSGTTTTSGVCCNHAHSGTTDNPNNNHSHTVNGNTGYISSDHSHSGTTGTVSSDHSHSGTTGTVSSWHTHTGSGTTGTVSSWHTHTGSGTSGGVSVNHTHATDIGSFTSGSTGSASVDVTMPYIQLMVCSKN